MFDLQIITLLALIDAGQLTLNTNVWNPLNQKYPLQPGRSLASDVGQITVNNSQPHRRMGR